MSVEQFQFGEHKVRVIDIDGEPWWIARDVCDVLEIVNVGDAVASLDDDERSNIANPDVARGGRPMAIINESGLYSLILRSRKPEAKAFKKWVTSKVLPSIRRTGIYLGTRAHADAPLRDRLAELAHKQNMVPMAGRVLAFHRWNKTPEGIAAVHEAFIQLELNFRPLSPEVDSGRPEIDGDEPGAA